METITSNREISHVLDFSRQNDILSVLKIYLAILETQNKILANLLTLSCHVILSYTARRNEY